MNDEGGVQRYQDGYIDLYLPKKGLERQINDCLVG